MYMVLCMYVYYVDVVNVDKPQIFPLVHVRCLSSLVYVNEVRGQGWFIGGWLG